MKEREYKYATEGSVIMYLSKYQILQQQELDWFAKNQTEFDSNNKCHIYFILKRPRTTINPDFFNFTEDLFEIEVSIQKENKFETRRLQIQHNFQDKTAKLITQYPYNFFNIQTEKREYVYKVGALLDDYHKFFYKEDDILDYEVLYIGQAFGEDGNRDAFDRLVSHSTLQKIYSEAITKNPDSEIWIMLASFKQRNIALMNGKVPYKLENDEVEVSRFNQFISTNFSEQQKINFTEAALIRTFEPKYNKEFKNTFPNPAHTSYDECYKLDLNSIAVETDFNEMKRWLYSEAKPRKSDSFMYWQFGKYHLVNEEERFLMFNNEYL